MSRIRLGQSVVLDSPYTFEALGIQGIVEEHYYVHSQKDGRNDRDTTSYAIQISVNARIYCGQKGEIYPCEAN